MKTATLFAVVALATTSLLALAAEDDARKAYSEIQKDLSKKYRDAASRQDKAKVLAGFADKYLAHATKYPDDYTATLALVHIVEYTKPGAKDGPRAKALDLLKGDAGKKPAIRRHLKTLTANPLDDEAMDLVLAISKSHPDKNTRAWAMMALVKGYEARNTQAQQLEKNAAFREQMEKGEGKETVKSLIDRAPNSRLRARQYRKRLDKEYPGVFPDLSVGKPMPEMLAEDLDGKKVKLSDYKGKVVVLDIWATWCGPCVRMIPHERKLVDRLKGKPFALVSVSVDDSKATVKDFMRRTSMPWTHWHIGPDSDYLDLWEVDGFPTIYVVDHKGIIRYKDVREKRMDDAVDDLLKELEDEKKE